VAISFAGSTRTAESESANISQVPPKARRSGCSAATSPRPSSIANRKRPERRVGAPALVERGDQRPDRLRQRRGDDVADALVGRRRQQTGRRQAFGEIRLDGETAQLEVAAGGQLELTVAELLRRGAQHAPLSGGDNAARQSDPGQRTVGGPVHADRAGARVGAVMAGCGGRHEPDPTLDGPVSIKKSLFV
jgi:hypothetical protein